MNPEEIFADNEAEEEENLEQLDQEDNETFELLDMLLAKKRAEDRKNWLQAKGDQVDLAV